MLVFVLVFRVQKKKEEEARQEEERKRLEVEAYAKSLVPDGYLLVECRKYAVSVVEDIEDVISSTSAKIMGSVLGGMEAEEALYQDLNSTRPSPTDLIQVCSISVYYIVKYYITLLAVSLGN